MNKLVEIIKLVFKVTVVATMSLLAVTFGSFMLASYLYSIGHPVWGTAALIAGLVVWSLLHLLEERFTGMQQANANSGRSG